MGALELVIALGCAIVAGEVIARRFTRPTPIVLVAAGLGLAALPFVGTVELPAEVVLVLFLPVLLFWESLTMSAREMRRYIRGITLTGVLLVIVTAAAVAVVGHALGLAWGTAWIIGAAVAPTDATAVAAMGRGLPRRTMVILRAESLINDGTALVIYALAVGLVTGEETLSAVHVASLFTVSFFGGILIGLAAGYGIFALRRRVHDPMVNNVILLLTPFVVYFLAEEVHASGVLAVVTCGLLWARISPAVVSASARQRATPFWSLTTFVLNGALFVLIGLELPVAAGGLVGSGIGTAILVTVAVHLTTIVTRFLFLVVSAYLIRLLDRRPSQRALRTTNRARAVSAVAGFRGAVSLAVALSVPATLAGEAFPARDMIVFVTAGVVVNTLLFQGLALPFVIRWAGLPEDHSARDELEAATRAADSEALAALPELADELGVGDATVDRLRREYADRLAESCHDQTTSGEASTTYGRRREAELRLALLSHQRSTVIRLRDEGRIDDAVLRQLQARLDLEEIRLSGGPIVE